MCCAEALAKEGLSRRSLGEGGESNPSGFFAVYFADFVIIESAGFLGSESVVRVENRRNREVRLQQSRPI